MIDTKKVKEILRDLAKGMSLSQISVQVGMKKSTLQGWIKKFIALGLTYQMVKDLNDWDIHDLLFKHKSASALYEPEWEIFVAECLSAKLTTQASYEKYKEEARGLAAMSRSHFFRKYKENEEKYKPEHEEIHIHNSFGPAEVAMIDYSGDGVKYHDPKSNKNLTAQIFVGVLGCSGLIFCMATENQKRNAWFSGIAEMFKFFGGVTDELWLDNSTPLVHKADRIDPILAPEFINFCEHYGTAPIAVPPYEPTYKGLAEKCVDIVQDSILKELNKRKFFSIKEINKAIEPYLTKLNASPITNDSIGLTRQERYEQREKNCLLPVPSIEFKEGVYFISRKVLKTNQIRIDNLRYGVKWGYAGKMVKIAINSMENTLTIYDASNNEEICTKALRKRGSGDEPMRKEDLPEYAQPLLMDRKELVEHISKDRPDSVRKLMEIIAKQANSQAKKHLRSFLNRFTRYDNETLDKLCSKALNHAEITYRNIIKDFDVYDSTHKTATAKDQQNPSDLKLADAPTDDVRGQEYYQSENKEKNNEQ